MENLQPVIIRTKIHAPPVEFRQHAVDGLLQLGDGFHDGQRVTLRQLRPHLGQKQLALLLAGVRHHAVNDDIEQIGPSRLTLLLEIVVHGMHL